MTKDRQDRPPALNLPPSIGGKIIVRLWLVTAKLNAWRTVSGGPRWAQEQAAVGRLILAGSMAAPLSATADITGV
jgi:hypothetical protein